MSPPPFKPHPAVRWIARVACPMDTLTGLGLMVRPELVMQWMGAAPIAAPELHSVIGAFVTAVGLAYLPVLRAADDAAGRGAARTAWTGTGVARLLVGLTVLGQLLAGRLDPAWWIVAASDLSLGTLQLLLLRTLPPLR